MVSPRTLVATASLAIRLKPDVLGCSKIEAHEDGVTMTLNGTHLDVCIKSANIDAIIFRGKPETGEDNSYMGVEIWTRKRGVNWLG
jgi:hypothetical protein